MQKSRIFLRIALAICEKTSKTHVHMRLFGKQPCMLPCTRFFKVYNDQKLFLMCRMVLEWREEEHGDVEVAVQGDLMAQQALRACGLY